jgi:hypothetical protein
MRGLAWMNVGGRMNWTLNSYFLVNLRLPDDEFNIWLLLTPSHPVYLTQAFPVLLLDTWNLTNEANIFLTSSTNENTLIFSHFIWCSQLKLKFMVTWCNIVGQLDNATGWSILHKLFLPFPSSNRNWITRICV